jgi:hypothetical protein
MPQVACDRPQYLQFMCFLMILKPERINYQRQ